MKKILALLLLLYALKATELGGFVGQASNEKGFFYGIYGGLNFLPMLSLEVEGVKYLSLEMISVGLDLQLSLCIGQVCPYGIFGYGIMSQPRQSPNLLDFDRLYNQVGGGMRFNVFSEVLEFRIDFRKVSPRFESPFYRGYIGVLLSL